MLFILCATEMKSWGREKRKHPCPKFPFKSEVWKDIKQSTQYYCCKKVNSASAAAQSLPHSQANNKKKIQGEWVPPGEMEFLTGLPPDYH